MPRRRRAMIAGATAMPRSRGQSRRLAKNLQQSRRRQNRPQRRRWEILNRSRPPAPAAPPPAPPPPPPSPGAAPTPSAAPGPAPSTPIEDTLKLFREWLLLDNDIP